MPDNTNSSPFRGLGGFLDSLKTDLINSMQAKGVNPGSAANNITVTTNGDQAQLQIPGYLQIAESGRGPTSKNAPKSNPPMIQRIQQWCREKGIPDREAWAVKKAIDKHGFKGYLLLISVKSFKL